MSSTKANQYIAYVIAGKIRPCKWVRLAVERHQRDLAKQDDPEFPFYFDEKKANKVCTFLQLLPHTKAKWAAAGQKLTLENWQCFLVCVAFGWVKKSSHNRRFRNVMWVIPRKNGKSLLAAGIGLYMLLEDGEHGSEVYCGATSLDQALEVFRPARQIVERTPALVSRYAKQKPSRKLESLTKSIHTLENGSRFQPVIGKPGDGASPHCAILDECHEIPDSQIRDTMITGMGAREQPMLLQITTAGVDISSPCYDDILEGRKILSGTIQADDTFFVEYTIDEDVAWESVEAIHQANPNINVSVSEEYLVSRLNEALRNPRNQNSYKIKHLNVWTSSKRSFFNMSSWNRCGDASLNIDDYAGRICYVGLDLASFKDFAAVCYVFPENDGTVAIFVQLFLPEKTAEEAGRDAYAGWVNSGKVIPTDGGMISHATILDEIINASEKFNIKEITFDTAQANQMMTDLSNAGFTLSRFKQWAANYSEAMKWCAAMMDEGKLKHPYAENDPMSWMVSNVVSRPNKKEEEYPDKERDELKIDGAIAMLMAVAVMLRDVETLSAYDMQGFVFA